MNGYLEHMHNEVAPGTLLNNRYRILSVLGQGEWELYTAPGTKT